ncbi:MAG: ParB/RepB/Spo0J family partition protein [Coriobacteriales bacterium]
MATKKGGLGKGLSALIADASMESGSGSSQEELLITQIQPNPDQPRKVFDEEELANLADSIRKEGLLQAIIVRPKDGMYQIVAGERRWQASKIAGLESVPVRIIEMDDEQALRIALVENLQRSDLNAIEEARGYKDLMARGDLTQAELAAAVSKSRSAVANSLRLLDLPQQIQDYVYDGALTAGHARAILSIPEEEKRTNLADKIIAEHLTVRDAENIARLVASGSGERAKRAPMPRTYKVVAKELRRELDTQVRIKSSRGKNKIEIEFKDEDDLQRIFNLIR